MQLSTSWSAAALCPTNLSHTYVWRRRNCPGFGRSAEPCPGALGHGWCVVSPGFQWLGGIAAGAGDRSKSRWSARLCGPGACIHRRGTKTEAYVSEALRLSPRDAHLYLWFYHIGTSKAYFGEYAQALFWLRKSIDANQNHPWAFFYSAACLAHLGRLDEARQEESAGTRSQS